MAILLYLIVSAFGSLSIGWAISVLWNWFVADSFNLPHLTILAAIGLRMAISLLTVDVATLAKTAREDDRKLDIRTLEACLIAAFGYPCLVGLGWIVHSLMS